MDTKLFDVFLDVARTLSFAETAKNLDVDPSSISRSVKSLEDELNCRLFQRTTRSLSLTNAGEQFLTRIDPLVIELNRVREEVKAEKNRAEGKVAISASVAFGQLCILPFLSEFLRLYPNIDLELKFTDRNIDMVTEQVDFAIRLAPSVEINIVRSRLMQTTYSLFATPEYLRNHPQILIPSDLYEHKMVTFDLPEFKNHWIFKNNQEICDIQIKPALSVSNALSVHALIMENIGPGILPSWVAQDSVDEGKIVRLLPNYQVTATSFDTAAWIIYPNRNFLPYRTRVAIDFFRARIRKKFS
jgi:DNA-binding transcriptional LysR family regulator